MGVPKTEDVERDLLEIAEVLIPAILDGYKWAADLGYEKPSRGPAESTTGSRLSDPTLSTVVDGERLRSKVKSVARLVRAAFNDLSGAKTILNQLLNQGDSVAFPEDEPFDRRSITQAEHRLLLEQKRRKGEGYGRR